MSSSKTKKDNDKAVQIAEASQSQSPIQNHFTPQMSSLPLDPLLFYLRDLSSTILHSVVHATMNMPFLLIIMNGSSLPPVHFINISKLSKPIKPYFKQSQCSAF